MTQEQAAPVAATGTVVATDLRESTRACQDLGVSPREFHGQLLTSYYDELAQEARPWLDAGPNELDVQTAGDGIQVAGLEPGAGLRLAWALQSRADRLAKVWAPKVETTGFRWATAVAVAGGELIRLEAPKRAAADCGDARFLRSVTGPAFNRAARMVDKIRMNSAVFSPLVDEMTKKGARLSSSDDFELFQVGRFDVADKARRDPKGAAAGAVNRTGRSELLYSLVAKGGVTTDLARDFGRAVELLLAGDRREAVWIFSRLAEMLERRESEIRDSLGEVALHRWTSALRQHSYVVIREC